MKVILRKFGNESYVVKDIELDNNAYKCEDKGVSETDILTILENKHNEFIKCSNCGDVIKNDAKSIKEHISRKDSHVGCFTCDYVRTAESKNQKIKYALNEDKTFHRSLTDDVKLECIASYPRNDIMNSATKIRCRYAMCSKETLVTGNTFFSKYPNAFDDMITVDALNFKELHEYNGWTILVLKCRGAIEAYANKNGIIDHFEVRTRYDSRNVYYSKKYNKLFYNKHGHYLEMESDYYWSRDKIDYIKKTISNLYV